MKHEPIFPQGVAVGGGITKREYFAIKMLQSMITVVDPKNDKADDIRKSIFKNAVAFADALLEELEKREIDG